MEDEEWKDLTTDEKLDWLRSEISDPLPPPASLISSSIALLIIREPFRSRPVSCRQTAPDSLEEIEQPLR